MLANTPDSSPIGASIANGAKLAAKQLNDDGGLLGEDVKVIVKDTEEKPQTGKSKYQDLTVGEEVDFTTGVFTSEVLLNIMDSIAEQETVHLSSGAATPDATKMVADNYDKYKYYFRTGPVNSHFLGQNMVDFADANFSNIGWDSVAVLAEDFKWTTPVTEVLQNELTKTGVSVPINRRYAASTQDFTPIYDDVQNSGVDAVYTVMAHTGTPALVQWVKQQRPFAFGGIHVPAQLPQYYALTKGACRFVLAQNTATPTAGVTDKTIPFSDAYHKQYDSYPVYTGYITFDAVKQWAKAAENTDSRAADDIIPELEGMTYTGTAGTLEYYGKDQTYPHDVMYGPDRAWPVWFQWQSKNDTGVQEVVWPDSLKTADYTQPPWV